MSSGKNSHLLDHLPKAKIANHWLTYSIWLVPIGAALLAGWFFYTNVITGGPTIRIYFDDVAGLQAGNSQVRFRGAQIGQVTDIKLTDDNRRVRVTAKIKASAKNVAREGSRFWIVKPRISPEGIKALRTIMSGDFITVEPGGGKQQTEFKGLSEPPIVEPHGVLRITLLTETLGSVKEGAPVMYRGVEVGQVVQSGLGKDSQAIRIIADIKPHYAPLVRMNSKFWNAGGIHANLSLSGLSVGAQSIETLLSGGIAFATPDATGKPANSGTAFRLYDKPDGDWLTWTPRIELPEIEASEEVTNVVLK